MAILSILQYPDPVLRLKAKPVTEFDDSLQKLIDDMFETMYMAPGIGLAAPQIGKSLRLFVYDLKESDELPRYKGVFVNPIFVRKEGEHWEEEGCLSVEEYRTRVARSAKVAVKGLDRDGKEYILEGEKLLARLLQHEMDHLDGMVFIDRLSSLKKNMYLSRMKKLRKIAEAG